MDDKKPSTSTNSPPPSTQPAASQPPNPAPLAKSPLISRRRFLQGALAASAVLAAASVGASGQILGPLIPPRLPSQTLIGTDTTTLESGYDGAVAAGTLYTDLLSGKVPSWTHFFYWPFDSTVSPYYKNVVCRLPDPVQLTSMSNAFTAANDLKSEFKMFFSFDYLGAGQPWQASDVVNILKAYGPNYAHMKFQGKLLSTPLQYI